MTMEVVNIAKYYVYRRKSPAFVEKRNRENLCTGVFVTFNSGNPTANLPSKTSTNPWTPASVSHAGESPSQRDYQPPGGLVAKIAMGATAKHSSGETWRAGMHDAGSAIPNLGERNPKDLETQVTRQREHYLTRWSRPQVGTIRFHMASDNF